MGFQTPLSILRMDNSKNNHHQEVDLGQLFNAIGAGFKSVLRFFKNGFLDLANLALEGIIFVRERILIFGIVTILGASAGAYLDYLDGPRYASKMILATNFNSGQLLYNEVAYLGALLKQQDSVQLFNRFNINPSEVGLIAMIDVEPIIDHSEELLAFDTYRLKMDTTMVSKAITFEEFKENFQDHQYRRHIVEATVYDKSLFKKIELGLLNTLYANKMLKLENKIAQENLILVDNTLNTSLVRVDSLLLAEQKSIEQISKSDGQLGTSIKMTETTRNAREVQLVEMKTQLAVELQLNNEKILVTENIADVITSFDEMAYKETSFTKKGSVKLGALAFLGLSLFYALVWFDRFLRKKIEQKTSKT